MDIGEYIKQIEQQQKQQDAIYRNAAFRYGLSDTAMWVLYFLSDFPDGCTQQMLCCQSFFAKQTVNTATGKLVRDGFVELLPIPGTRNQKNVRLTQTGLKLAHDTTDHLKNNERNAFSRFTEEQLKTYLEILRKITQYLREEIE